MSLEDAKLEMNTILGKVINGAEEYYLDGKYVRWGLVQKDLYAVLERHLTPHEADALPECTQCEYRPCDRDNNADYCPARR